MAPLLQPADCCLLLVDPRQTHVDGLDPTRRSELMRCLGLAIDAAHAGAVPNHLAFAGTPPEAQEWAPASRPYPAAHTHALGTAGRSWSNSRLHAVLAEESRPSLIVAGFWLETTVTFLALPALASGFEVFVLMDATPASAQTAARPAADRLLQAGAVPITTPQLIAEWLEMSPDPDVRSALSRLTSAD